MDSDLEFELELKDSYDISATITSEFSRQRRKDNRNRKDIANMMKNNNHNCQRNRNSDDSCKSSQKIRTTGRVSHFDSKQNNRRTTKPPIRPPSPLPNAFAYNFQDEHQNFSKEQHRMSHVYNDSNAYDGQCLRPHITRIRRTQTPPRTSYNEPKFSKSPNYPVSYNCQLVRQQSHLLQIQNPFIEEENFSIHSRTTMKTPIISRLSVASDEVSVPVGPTWNTHKGIDYSDLDSAEEFTIAKRHYTCDGNPVNRKWKKITENEDEDEYEDEYRYPVHFQALPFHGIEAEKSQSCTKNLNQKLYSFPSYPSIQSQSSSYGTFLANDRPSFSNDFISLPHDSQQATGGPFDFDFSLISVSEPITVNSKSCQLNCVSTRSNEVIMLTANQNPALSLFASSTGGEPHMEIVDDANSENCEKKEDKCNSTNGTDTTLSIKGMPSSSSNRQVNRSPNVIIGLDRISSLISTLPNQCSIDFGDYFSVKAHIVNTQIENNYCSQMNEDSTTLIIDCDPEADGTNDPHRVVNVSFSTNDSDHKKVCMVDKKLQNFATQLLFEEFINQEILLIVSEVFHKTSKKLADKNKEQDNSLRCFDKCYKEKKQKLKETEETLKDAIAAKEQLKEELNKQKNVEVTDAASNTLLSLSAMDHTPEEFQQLKDQHSEMKIQLQFALLEKTELQNKINDDQQQLEIKKKACIKSSDDYKSLSSENKKLKERTVELESDLRKEKSTSKNIREGLHKERIRLTNKLLEAESKNTEYEQKCEQLRSENHQLRSTQANMIALLQQNCQIDQRSTTDVQWAERRQ